MEASLVLSHHLLRVCLKTVLWSLDHAMPAEQEGSRSYKTPANQTGLRFIIETLISFYHFFLDAKVKLDLPCHIFLKLLAHYGNECRLGHT